MARISNHTVKQVNVTIVPDSIVKTQLVDSHALGGKLRDLFESAEPVIINLPEIVSVVDPKNKMGVNILQQENRVVISDDSITPYTNRPLENLIKLTQHVDKIVFRNEENPIKIRVYGFNISSSLDLNPNNDGDEPILAGKYILDNFISGGKIENIDGDPESAGVQLVYTKNDVRYTLKVAARVTSRDLEDTKTLSIEFNAHFKKTLPEDYTAIEAEFNANYARLGEDLRILE